MSQLALFEDANSSEKVQEASRGSVSKSVVRGGSRAGQEGCNPQADGDGEWLSGGARGEQRAKVLVSTAAEEELCALDDVESGS